MAIHPDLPGIEIFIAYDSGDRAIEYDAPIDDLVESLIEEGDIEGEAHHTRVTIAKYIEAVTDQEFTIVLKIGQSHTSDCEALSFQTCLDGRYIDLTFADSLDLRRLPWSYTIDSVSTQRESGKGYVWRKLLFAAIPTTDNVLKNRVVKAQKAAYNDSGVIFVEVHRQNEPNKTEKSHRNYSKFGGVEEGEMIASKILINKSHGIKLGDTAKPKKRVQYETNYVDGVERPLGNYIFRYKAKHELDEILYGPSSPGSDVVEIPRPESRRDSKLLITPPTEKVNPEPLGVPHADPSAAIKTKDVKTKDVKTEDIKTTVNDTLGHSSSQPLLTVAGVSPEQILLMEKKLRKGVLEQFLTDQMAPSGSAPNLKREIDRLEVEVEIMMREQRRPVKRKQKKSLGKMIVDLTEVDQELITGPMIEIED